MSTDCRRRRRRTVRVSASRTSPSSAVGRARSRTRCLAPRGRRSSWPDGDEVVLPPGRYAVKDKAGKGAFDLKQARAYSEDLNKTAGMRIDGKEMDGVVY